MASAGTGKQGAVSHLDGAISFQHVRGCGEGQGGLASLLCVQQRLQGSCLVSSAWHASSAPTATHCGHAMEPAHRPSAAGLLKASACKGCQGAEAVMPGPI